jgi:adenylyltransferase/sulfurtransferase
VTTFSGGADGPCYRCPFPEAPPPGTIEDCATAGVLGVLPGTVGAIQATEAIKHLIGVGDSLDGRLLVYDALGTSFEEVPVRRDPDCPVCGEGGIDSVAEVEYADTCAVAAPADPAN